MKKIYIAPSTQAVDFAPMQILAASIEVNTDTSNAVDPSTSFSTEKGWSAESWTATDED